MASLPESCIQEVIDLHEFFQLWLDGTLPDTEKAFARFSESTSHDFAIISPDGSLATGLDTASWIRATHGTRRGFRLWTDQHHAHFCDAQACVVTYQEWQTRDGATTTRISTAVFTARPTAPNGVAWVHVHETWLNL